MGAAADNTVHAAAEAVLRFVESGERAFHRDSRGQMLRSALEREALRIAQERLGPRGDALLERLRTILGHDGRRPLFDGLLRFGRPGETAGRRFRAARALGLSDRPDVATRPLVAALQDPEPLVCIAAADGLLDLGQADSHVIAGLRRALGDENKRVRFHASLALAGLDHRAEEAIPALAEGLTSHDWANRDRASTALAAMGSAARIAAPLVLAALNEEQLSPLKVKLREAYARINGVVVGHTLHGM